MSTFYKEVDIKAKNIEIVINSCHGGFNLSNEAVYELIKLNSSVISSCTLDEYFGGRICLAHIEPYKDGFSSYYIPGTLFKDGLVYQVERYNYDNRINPDLISVVKRLKSKANGHCSNLKVVKIPAGTVWTLSEYDGLECIEEVHKTWS